MKLLFVLTILALIAASFYADYKWKQWIAARKQERDRPPHPTSFAPGSNQDQQK
jgi:hypothetical protein